MNKALVAIGVFVLVVGILLSALPFVSVPKTTFGAYIVPKSTLLIGGFGPLMDVAPTYNVSEGITL